MFLSYQCFTTVEVINELVIDAFEHQVDNPSIMWKCSSCEQNFFSTMWKNFVEDHDLIQLSGIIGITVSYVLVVIFNTVNGVGGTLQIY